MYWKLETLISTFQRKIKLMGYLTYQVCLCCHKFIFSMKIVHKSCHQIIYISLFAFSNQGMAKIKICEVWDLEGEEVWAVVNRNSVRLIGTRTTYIILQCITTLTLKYFHVYTEGKLNVHKTFRRCPRRLLNVLCTFNLRPVSTGLFQEELRKKIIGNINIFKRLF